LVVACGTGAFAEDLVRALEPAQLTLNDLSVQMLRRSAARVRGLAWRGSLTLLPGDITRQRGNGQCDLVAVNYTLNLFPPPERVRFLRAATSHLADHGVMMVADFVRPVSRAMRALSQLNWGLMVLFFWLAAGNKPNALGDMESDLLTAGLRVVKKRTFVGGLYASFVLRRELGSEGPHGAVNFGPEDR
jgi:ubiquinone/menaquinone biosynthesis C-methylase UbiE